jgi:hypothetical protein
MVSLRFVAATALLLATTGLAALTPTTLFVNCSLAGYELRLRSTLFKNFAVVDFSSDHVSPLPVIPTSTSFCAGPTCVIGPSTPAAVYYGYDRLCRCCDPRAQFIALPRRPRVRQAVRPSDHWCRRHRVRRMHVFPGRLFLFQRHGVTLHPHRSTSSRERAQAWCMTSTAADQQAGEFIHMKNFASYYNEDK